MAEVGGAVGGGGAVIPDGPGAPQMMGRCVSVRRWERMEVFTVQHEYMQKQGNSPLNQIWQSLCRVQCMCIYTSNIVTQYAYQCVCCIHSVMRSLGSVV